MIDRKEEGQPIIQIFLTKESFLQRPHLILCRLREIPVVPLKGAENGIPLWFLMTEKSVLNIINLPVVQQISLTFTLSLGILAWPQLQFGKLPIKFHSQNREGFKKLNDSF